MPPLYLLQNVGGSLWCPPGAVGVVTGANKGIGLEIAAGLAANGLPVVAAARSAERGRAAVEAIKSRAETRGAEVSFLQLDVASDASVAEFAKNLRGVAPAGVAVLVNNAAIAFKGDTWGGDEAEETVNTNYRGTRRVTEAVLPMMVEGGRVVNVCSRSGQLGRLFGGGEGAGGKVGSGGGSGSSGGSGGGGSPPRRPRPPPVSDCCERLRGKWEQAAEAGDFSAIDQLASEFVAAVREGTAGFAGWPRSMYGVSKLAQICYTRALALAFSRSSSPSSPKRNDKDDDGASKDEDDDGNGGAKKKELYKSGARKGLGAFALCPGSVRTDMSSQRGSKSPEEGADTAVWLSLAPKAPLSGRFYGEREVIDF